MLDALKISFSQLEEKTKLELQLLQSDPKFWQFALRDKLLRVSQLFSSQATDQIHFNDAESRWAYLGTYTAAHATLVQAIVTSGRFQPLTDFLKGRNSKERLVYFSAVMIIIIYWELACGQNIDKKPHTVVLLHSDITYENLAMILVLLFSGYMSAVLVQGQVVRFLVSINFCHPTQSGCFWITVSNGLILHRSSCGMFAAYHFVMVPLTFVRASVKTKGNYKSSLQAMLLRR